VAEYWLKTGVSGGYGTSGSQTIRITSSPSAIREAIPTHRQLDDAAVARVGISPAMIRLSIGLEHIDDIGQALDA
jgi:O-acetylhomoserine/O-acetylserine sulfhydrylase-like pyridoxal-dependent enzyme